MRNFTPVKAGSGGTGDYAEYLLKTEALKKSSEYYVEGEKEATASVYIGSKSAKLGLSGEIDLESAKDLLAGVLPDGTQIRGDKTTGQEILAHDNTLSAPKSVSIQAAEDIRVFECHVAAVRETIAALEKYYCVQRVQKEGVRTLEKGDGFVGWMTHHWQSREGDIDMHAHVVTMNGCMGPDGKWRAIDDREMSDAQWLGSYYRNCLAQRLQNVGYKIREKPLERGGYSFDLEGYTDQDIDEFSTRHKQIAEAKKKGLSDQEAWYTTRKDKDEEISLGELFEKTITQKAAIGCTGQSFPMTMNLRPIGKTDAIAVVDRAIAHLSRGSCRFTQAELLAECFDHIERVRLKDVERAIATHPELVDYGIIRGIDYLKGEYTTAGALERETRIIQRWMQGQGQAIPIMDKVASKEAIARLETRYKKEWAQSHDSKLNDLRAKIAEGDISKKTAKALKRLEKQEFQGLNKGQVGAVQGVLATDNKNAIIYGLSGVGKTRSLKPLKDILDEQKIETLWLAPSLAAVEVLTEDVGQQAYTLQRLAYTDSIRLEPGQIVFVDEAGLADAECIDLVGAKVEAAGARLILIGDHKQNKPIQAGSPMTSLMMHEAEVFKIWEILRQQDPIQKQAVELIANGKGVESIELLNEHGYVTEIKDPDLRQEAIASQYLSMTVPERKNTLLITGTNAERLALTEKIRQGLKEDGFLGKSLDCIQLEDSRLSPEQLNDLRNYEIGDYVAPMRDYAKAKRHEFCKVIGKTETHLILEKANGETFELDPNRWDKKKYTAGTINVAVGDELRFRGKINGKDFENGQIYTVKSIEGAIATLEGKKGKTRTIDLSRPAPIDHNIVRTTYDVQGSGKDGAILSLTDDRTSNQGSAYVGISRQFEFLTVYTQNYDELLKRIARECTHYNALDLLELNHDEQNYETRSASDLSGDGSLDIPLALGEGFAGRTRRAGESAIDTGRGRGAEQALLAGGAGFGNHPDQPRYAKTIARDIDGSANIDAKPRENLGSDLECLDRIAQGIYRTRIRRELSRPLEQFMAQFSELKALEAQIKEVSATNKDLQARIAAKLQQVVDSAKIEVLSTALKDWRGIEGTEIRAQTAVKFALEELTEARNTVNKRFMAVTKNADINRTKTITDKNLGSHKGGAKEPIPHPIKVSKPPAPENQTQDKPKVRVKPPSPVKADLSFWTPDYSNVDIPEGFMDWHWNEVMGSAIHPALIAGNMERASGNWVIDRLAKVVLEDSTVSDVSKENLREKYNPVVADGFWFNGGYDIKILATAAPGDRIPRTDWGVYKSFTPRLDEEKTQRKGEPSYRKYENPIGQRREFFMPIVPPDMADEIYRKYGISPTAAERESGLYYVALKYNLPIIITEGAKKTMASVSQGHITIGMQGVNALYRSRDDEGNRLPERVFNESFACWATPGRQIIFAFDADSKQASIVAVRRALAHSVELLQQHGCDVWVAAWLPEQGKGLDDVIVKSGALVYDNALKTAQPPDAEIDAHYTWEYERVAAKFTNPTDAKIYAEMIATNPQDAERVLRQSDRARTLKDPVLVQKYIEEIASSKVEAIVAAEPPVQRDTKRVLDKPTVAKVKPDQPIAVQVAPNALIMAGADLVFFNDGKLQPDGSEVAEGQRWRFERDGGHLKISLQETGEVAYEVRQGIVVNRAGEDALRTRMEELRQMAIQMKIAQADARAATEPEQGQRAGRRR
jgi:conjugative relaxase-like TrwC/TraI family protein